MSRRIEARLESAAKAQEELPFPACTAAISLCLSSSLSFSPSPRRFPFYYHLTTLPRGPTQSVSQSLRLLRICRIGKCKVGGCGRKRASMRTSKGISSASSMQSSSQDENVVADKQQRALEEEGNGKEEPLQDILRGGRGVSVTRVPLIR